MATNFEDDEVECQGGECDETAGVSYYVTEQRKLCDSCATKQGCSIQTRKEKIKWQCEEHDERIKLFCDGSHGCQYRFSQGPHLGCSTCGHLYQSKVHCHWEDVKKAVAMRRKEIEDNHCTLSQYQTSLEEALLNAAKVREDGEAHLTSVITDINALFDKEIEALNVKEQNDVATINEKADAEVQRIEEARAEQIRQVQEDAVKQREPFETRHRELTVRITEIADEYLKNMAELMQQVPDISKALLEIITKIEKVLKDDKDILFMKEDVVQSAQDAINQYRLNYESRTGESSSIHRMRFITRENCSIIEGRLDGHYDSWQEVHAFEVSLPEGRIVLSVDDDSVLLGQKSRFSSGSDQFTSVHKINLKGTETHSFIGYEERLTVQSCACLNQNSFACHVISREPSTHSIRIYDKQGCLVKELSPDVSLRNDQPIISLSSDRNGMILLLVHDRINNYQQYKIYVIDPSNGATIRTISNDIPDSQYGYPTLASTSSGNIVIGNGECLYIIDQTSERLEISIRRPCEYIHRWAIDTLTDVLFVVRQGRFGEGRGLKVDQIFSSGIKKASSIISIPSWTYLDNASNIIITPSGKVVIQNGKEVKTFARSTVH